MTVSQDALREQKIATQLDENVSFVNRLLGVGISWDVIAKPFVFSGIRMMSYTTNGFFLTMNMVMILENLENTVRNFVQTRPDRRFALKELVDYLDSHIAFVQVQPVPSMADAIRFILSGAMVTFLDGYDQALLIDTRIYPMRGVEESEVERVIRGPRDGFTETMLINVALIRRRLRDPRLRSELMQVGSRSQTDVTLMYLQDVTNASIVNNIRDQLKAISVDAVTMAEQSVTDLIGRVKWNPYPIVRYTERPDVAATALLEGQVVIVVDTSPEVIIAPATFFNHMQHPQEYHSYPLVGTYLRWVILLALFISTLLPGVFLMSNSHPELVPSWMRFFRAEQNFPLPLWSELLIAEVMLDMLRLAVNNTPAAIASSVSILAAVLFGEFAAKIQLLQPEVMVYMAFVVIAQLAMSSFELGSANQIARFWIIIWTAALYKWGFLISVVSWIVFLCSTKSFGVPYMWPLIPFRWKDGLEDVVLRRPTISMTGRPAIFHPKTRRRKP
jgi:stage V sporulation protein AF